MFKKEKLDRVRQGPPPSINLLISSRSLLVSCHCHASSDSCTVLFAFFSFNLFKEGVSHPWVDLFSRKANIFEVVSWISRRLCGLTCMTMRRSSMRWSSMHVSWACGWFNNAVVRVWIERSLSLPWLFSRQAKLKETSRLPGSDLEEGESVWQSEYMNDASWASETESPQTDNEWGCSQRVRWKRDRKKSLEGVLPGRKTPDFFFLTAYEHDQSCTSTVRACRRTRSARQLWIRVRGSGWNHEPVANFWPWSIDRRSPQPWSLSVGGVCCWLVSAVFWAWTERKLLFPWPVSKRKWNARTHWVCMHLKNFQSLRSYRTHQHTLFNWGDANSQSAKEGGSFEECDATKPDSTSSLHLDKDPRIAREVRDVRLYSCWSSVLRRDIWAPRACAVLDCWRQGIAWQRSLARCLLPCSRALRAKKIFNSFTSFSRWKCFISSVAKSSLIQLDMQLHKAKGESLSGKITIHTIWILKKW